MIAKSIEGLIGNTPLVQVSGFERQNALCGKILAKLEMKNPSGSVKDRAAYSMILDAKNSGRLEGGGNIIEATSGNLGISLAMLGASLGYGVHLTMPSSMSIERQKLLTHYGAKLQLTDPSLGMSGAISKAMELEAKLKGSVFLRQFENKSNPLAHSTTAQEIWDATFGDIDIFVATVGTGGTFSGCAKFFKHKNPDILCYAVEPSQSPVLSGGKLGQHGIQGIGAGFVPKNFDISVCDGVLTVSTLQAIHSAHAIAKTDGYAVGISSGAALHAAAMLNAKNKTIVTVFPDGAERYLSTI